MYPLLATGMLREIPRCAKMKMTELTFFLVQPDWTRMAKSPTSCGTSCSRIVMVVMNPMLRPTM